MADDEWLDLAGSRGWVVFMKDTRIRYNRAEREAVVRACGEPGPFIYAVHRTRIEKLPIGDG